MHALCYVVVESELKAWQEKQGRMAHKLNQTCSQHGVTFPVDTRGSFLQVSFAKPK
jgi:glutamate-1-semialdehyde aminotransferase